MDATQIKENTLVSFWIYYYTITIPRIFYFGLKTYINAYLTKYFFKSKTAISYPCTFILLYFRLINGRNSWEIFNSPELVSHTWNKILSFGVKLDMSTLSSYLMRSKFETQALQSSVGHLHLSVSIRILEVKTLILFFLCVFFSLSYASMHIFPPDLSELSGDANKI